MVIETASRRKVLRTHASRQHILRFREGYARKCDYDYRPRLGLNIEDEGWMNRENVQHEHEENQPGPQQKEEVVERKQKKGGDQAKVRNITSDIQNNTYRPKKTQQTADGDEQTGWRG